MQASPDLLTFDREAPRRQPRLARVVVRTSVAEARRDWDALVKRVPCSPYQTPDWLVPWLATVGTKVRPAFATGFDHEGTPIALLPLGLHERAGLTVARFLGEPDVNTGLGLFDPEAMLDGAAMRVLLRETARQAGIDLYLLRHQPYAWAGHANPLAQCVHWASASHQHEADLIASAERFFAATQSKRARKTLRQKDAKLAALGPVRHRIAETPAEALAIVQALTTHRAERYGSDVRRQALRDFLLQAGRPLSPGLVAAVELHGLFCGDHLVSAFAGTRHGGRFSGMMTAFDPHPRWARHSPGELLLARIVAQKCEAGLEIFDLGVGEARYKDGFCPRAEPLFDTILGTTRQGRVAAAVMWAHLSLKRRAKRTPWLTRLRRRMRRAWLRVSGSLSLEDGL